MEHSVRFSIPICRGEARSPEGLVPFGDAATVTFALIDWVPHSQLVRLDFLNYRTTCTPGGGVGGKHSIQTYVVEDERLFGVFHCFLSVRHCDSAVESVGGKVLPHLQRSM